MRQYLQESYDSALAENVELLDRITDLKAQVAALEAVLEEAVIGIQWYINEYPEAASGADDEFMERAQAALKQEET